jgi:hypothetical protein
MKTQLHQILAIEASKKEREKQVLDETTREFKERRTKHFTATRTNKKTNIEGFPDEPEETRLVSSVLQRLEFTLDELADPFNVELTKEMTNSGGNAEAELKVGNKSFGKFSATALIALHRKLKRLREVFAIAPTVDVGACKWEEFTEYADTKIKHVLVSPTTIGNRPKIRKVERRIEGYPDDPKSPHATMEEEYNLGTIETTKYSSELLPSIKAKFLTRLDTLISAVNTARSEANSTEIVEVKKAKELFDFILNG